MAAILASQPSSIGQVLDQGFRLFRVGVKGLLPFTTVAAVFSCIAQFLLPSGMGAMTGPGSAGASLARLGLVAGIWILVVLIILFILQCAMLHRISTLANNSGSTGESWRVGARRAPSAILSVFLLMLAVGATAGVTAVILMLLQIVIGKPAAGVIAGIVVVGLVTFMIVRLLYFLPESVIRSAGPIQALNASWRITRGHFWRITILLTVVVLAAFALYLIIGVVINAVVMMFARSAASPTTAVTISAAIVAGLTQFISEPLSVGMTYAIWHDLRLRAEGTDIAARIDALTPGR
jgi:membrane-anchored glycerophosphoryl diester phosphodiesterase (GDPDase)